MKKDDPKASERPPARPIGLVCVSRHARLGAVQQDPDRLTLVRGKWAWCPSGAGSGHEWKAVKAGSLNPLRAQLVEVSRLVDVALNNPGASSDTRKTSQPKGTRKKR